jgi:putative NADH-flavin reductase
MTTAAIGAAGHVGSEIVRGVLARGDPVSGGNRRDAQGRGGH